jgi:hypothetical protein
MTDARLRSRSARLRHSHRLITRFNRTLARMRAGATLQLQHGPSGPAYSLSNGEPVARDLAALIISYPNVVPADFGLFPDPVLGQTWEVKND